LPEEMLVWAAAAMDRILAQEPQLNDFGIGVYDWRLKSPAERTEELARLREEIRRPDALAAFLAARGWLRRFGKLKAVNRRGTSYGLKHVAEKEIGYLTNGVFIAAAIAEGFTVRQAGWRSPNVWLNVSSRAWRPECKMPPKGASPLLRFAQFARFLYTIRRKCQVI
jgi:hypothetical protein